MGPPTAAAIESWLAARIGDLTGTPPAAVDRDAPLARHGLDSVALVALAADLEAWLGYRFRENPLQKYPTVASLAGFLADEVGRPNASGPA